MNISAPEQATPVAKLPTKTALHDLPELQKLDDSAAIRQSMLNIFHTRVLPHCDDAPANTDFYRRFREDIESGQISDMHTFANRIPAHIRTADDHLCMHAATPAPLPIKNVKLTGGAKPKRKR